MLRTITARVSTRSLTLTPSRSFVATAFARSSTLDPPADDSKIHPSLVADPPASNPSAATDPWTLERPAMPEPPQLDPRIHTMDDLIRSPHPEGRDNEPTETLRKRLVYESRKRGILEMDLILSTFAKERLPEMDERQLREYDRVRLPTLCVAYSRWC